jgi:hypothetical protein
MWLCWIFYNHQKRTQSHYWPELPRGRFGKPKTSVLCWDFWGKSPFRTGFSNRSPPTFRRLSRQYCLLRWLLFEFWKLNKNLKHDWYIYPEFKILGISLSITFSKVLISKVWNPKIMLLTSIFADIWCLFKKAWIKASYFTSCRCLEVLMYTHLPSSDFLS